MSPKLPRLTGRELSRVLERAGWQLDRTSGSHFIYIYPPTRQTLSVPRHNRPMSIGTLSRLVKQAGLSRDELTRRR